MTDFSKQGDSRQLCRHYHPCDQPSIFEPTLDYTVAVPINLAKSLEGKYFVGYADNLNFGAGQVPGPDCSIHFTLKSICMLQFGL